MSRYAQKVNGQVIGGSPRTLDDCATVADVADRMNAKGYTALVNGSPAKPSDLLPDFAYVSFAPAVKGGC